MNDKLQALYGLKFNPFTPDVPVEALMTTPALESFFWRIDNGLAREGGFALLSGEPGTGKSAALRILTHRLASHSELAVRALARPQASLADFYRELGDLFGVPLSPHNRWAGFKNLRERWAAHIDSTLLRPVLLIDESQEMCPAVFSELRLLSSTNFDSRIILSVVLAGDARLNDMLRRNELLALGSRIRTRLTLEYTSPNDLLACLKHLIKAAGATQIMTPQLMSTICEHAAGNRRIMTTIAANLLAVAAQRELPQLDEKLYFDVFAQPHKAPRKTATPRP